MYFFLIESTCYIHQHRLPHAIQHLDQTPSAIPSYLFVFQNNGKSLETNKSGPRDTAKVQAASGTRGRVSDRQERID